MTREIEQLVADVIDITGADGPSLLDADAPTLVAPPGGDSIYFVGLIGGKDVGKSSLVNALVGRAISEPTSHGPGTETVIAYAHRDVSDEVRALLEREVPRQFSIVTHEQDLVRRQVLLDLPDIDSRYASHLQLTRRMLRQMLYPIWIQSVEKYADQQPQQLLAAVAEGNDPGNFVFCLNKIDQLVAPGAVNGEAVEQVKSDFAARIAHAADDLTGARLCHQRNERRQRRSAGAAATARAGKNDRHRARIATACTAPAGSFAAGMDRSTRPAAAGPDPHTIAGASRRADRRADCPSPTRASMPRLSDDPGYRLALLEPALHKRMSRWPVVNVIDSVLAPLLSLVKRNLSVSPAAGSGVELDVYLSSDGRPISTLVQATFAQLYSTQPDLGMFYVEQKLWDDLPADTAAARLRQRLNAAVDRQRQAVMQRVAGRFGIISPLFRWALTIGAILWFPFIQPVLHLMLAGGLKTSGIELARLIVELLGVTYLLKNVTFLLIWFVVLWAILRWDTQRRVERLLNRWKSTASMEDPTSLSGQVLGWIDELIEPIRVQRARIEAIVSRVDQARRQPRDCSVGCKSMWRQFRFELQGAPDRT